MTCVQSLLTPGVEIILEDEKYRPVRGSAMAAGFDLRVKVQSGSVSLDPGEVIKFSAGFRLNIKNPLVAMLVLPRSGTGARGLHVANVVGLIDADYQGEVFIALRNVSGGKFIIEDGDRVAQGLFTPVVLPSFTTVTEFSSTTERSDGGFGSTGTK